MTALIDALRKRGWVIRESANPTPLLPDELRSRYPAVPVAVTDFLERLEVCQNAEEDVWFLTAADFRRTDADEGFRWNEYEHMALDSSDGDHAARAAIRAFWNDHLPIMLAVHSDYDYLAVRVSGPNAGAIVHGFAPDWEEPAQVARSFEGLLQALTAEAVSRDPEYPFSVFL